MAMTINAGSLRHVIDWYQQVSGSDDYGNPIGLVKVYDTIMANVRVTSGNQNENFGAILTDEVITVLTWYDPRIDNGMFVRWNGIDYEIQHIKPDELMRGMVVTAKVSRDG